MKQAEESIFKHSLIEIDISLFAPAPIQAGAD